MAERNMDMKKCPMPVQDPDVRNKTLMKQHLATRMIWQ